MNPLTVAAKASITQVQLTVGLGISVKEVTRCNPFHMVGLGLEDYNTSIVHKHQYDAAFLNGRA